MGCRSGREALLSPHPQADTKHWREALHWVMGWSRATPSVIRFGTQLCWAGGRCWKSRVNKTKWSHSLLHNPSTDRKLPTLAALALWSAPSQFQGVSFYYSNKNMRGKDCPYPPVYSRDQTTKSEEMLQLRAMPDPSRVGDLVPSYGSSISLIHFSLSTFKKSHQGNLWRRRTCLLVSLLILLRVQISLWKPGEPLCPASSSWLIFVL